MSEGSSPPEGERRPFYKTAIGAGCLACLLFTGLRIWFFEYLVKTSSVGRSAEPTMGWDIKINPVIPGESSQHRADGTSRNPAQRQLQQQPRGSPPPLPSPLTPAGWFQQPLPKVGSTSRGEPAPQPEAPDQGVLPGNWRPYLATTSAFAYLAGAFPAVLLVVVGRRRLFALPVAIGLAMSFASAVSWAIRVEAKGVAGMAAAAFLAAGLMLAPAGVVALRPPRVSHGSGADRATILGLAACFLIVVVVREAFAWPSGFTAIGLVSATVPAFVFGAGIGTRRPWWPWAQSTPSVFSFMGFLIAGLVFPLRFAESAMGNLSQIDLFSGQGAGLDLGHHLLFTTVPALLVVYIAAMWEPLSKRLRKRLPTRERESIKDPDLDELVEALVASLGPDSFLISPLWDDDFEEIGFTSVDDENVLVYVSVRDQRDGRYHYECEVPDPEVEGGQATVSQGDGVDLNTLVRAIGEHFSRL